jgi:hypothetical protein
VAPTPGTQIIGYGEITFRHLPLSLKSLSLAIYLGTYSQATGMMPNGRAVKSRLENH